MRRSSRRSVCITTSRTLRRSSSVTSCPQPCCGPSCAACRRGPAGSRWSTSLFAFFGSGAENLVWGFQIGFVAAVTLGLGQLVLADRPGPVSVGDVVGGLLGVVGVMTAGIAVTMIGTVAIVLAIRRRWLALLPQVLVPALTYGAWYVAYGRSRINSPPSDLSLVPDYVSTGVSNAVEQLTQLPQLGLAIAIVIIVAVVGRRADLAGSALPFGMACGVVLLFADQWSRTSDVRDRAGPRLHVTSMLRPPCSFPRSVSLRVFSSGDTRRATTVLVWSLMLWAIIGNVADYYRVRQVRLDMLATTRPVIEAAAVEVDRARRRPDGSTGAGSRIPTSRWPLFASSSRRATCPSMQRSWVRGRRR